MNSSDAAQELSALRRADHLCLALDGEKISQEEQRHATYNDSRSILRSIIEARVLSPKCIIDVVFTKWDIVASAIEADSSGAIASFIDRIKSTLSTSAQDFDIRFHQVAARPPKDARIPFAYGLPTLLRSWMDHGYSKAGRQKLYSQDNSNREFSRFTEAMIVRNRLEDHYDIRRL